VNWGWRINDGRWHRLRLGLLFRFSFGVHGRLLVVDRLLGLCRIVEGVLVGFGSILRGIGETVDWVGFLSRSLSRLEGNRRLAVLVKLGVLVSYFGFISSAHLSHLNRITKNELHH